MNADELFFPLPFVVHVGKINIVADIFYYAEFDSVEHKIFVAVFVKQLPAHIRLQKNIRTGYFQGVFDSIIVPVRCKSVFIADLIGYFEMMKNSRCVDVQAGLALDVPVVLFGLRMPLLII